MERIAIHHIACNVKCVFSSYGNLVVPQTRRRIGDRAFSVAATRAWNRLPTELKLMRSTDSVMRPRSSSRGRNTSASVTVTVTVYNALSVNNFRHGHVVECRRRSCRGCPVYCLVVCRRLQVYSHYYYQRRYIDHCRRQSTT